MNAKAVVLTADQVLRVFHHDEIYLFLGAAFATIGIVAGDISSFDRKFDPLPLWLAICDALRQPPLAADRPAGAHGAVQPLLEDLVLDRVWT